MVCEESNVMKWSVSRVNKISKKLNIFANFPYSLLGITIIKELSYNMVSTMVRDSSHANCFRQINGCWGL